MSSSVFREAAAKSKRELVIKKDTSSLKSPEALAIERGDYEALFSVTALNHLVISGFPEVSSLSPKIGQLQQLFQLVLTDNALTDLPNEIGSLTKLKHLDVSRNKLSSLPTSFYTLSTLQAVFLGNNCLTDESFPPDPPKDCFPSLHHIDLVGNQLTHLPSFVYLSHGLQELVAIDNQIAALESTIAELSSLKEADLKRNQLTVLPYELSLCSKLKSLDLVDNPLSDRRLLKLVTQHGPTKPKAILDYIASHSTKPASPEKKGKGKRRSGPTASAAIESDEEVVFSDSKTRVRVVRPVEHVEVWAHAEARRVRSFLVCAIVRGVDLSSDNNFKKFITLQTKLHDGVCKRRRAATIATHDLSKLSVPLSYTSHPAMDIEMVPLGRATPISVQEFLYELEASKMDKRGGGGGKKGAKKAVTEETDPTAAALSKYLQFVDPQEMVCIRDSTGTVVSLPPLTNSENTKIEEATTDLFLEVTSSANLATCKSVMDSLVCGMCESGVGVSSDGVMHVEQVKVLEHTSKQLLVMYPSRTDLVEYSSISVERPD